MSGAILRRRDQTNRPLRVDHYSAAVNTYEFTMPKDLAIHMASTIQKLANPAAARSTARRAGRP